MSIEAEVLDRVYTRCSNAIGEAGRERESLFLCRLVLLLLEQLGDEAASMAAIDAALHDLPIPSLSAG